MMSPPDMLAWLLDQGAFWRLSVELSANSMDTWQIGIFHRGALQTYEGKNWREAVQRAYSEVRKG